MDGKGPSGFALASVTAGIIFMWSAVKGVAVTRVIRELVSGESPTQTIDYPITAQKASGASGDDSFTPTGDAGRLISEAMKRIGQCYGFGAGHGGDPCASKCTDCSSFVCCCINKATGSKINMATGGLAGYGTGISYDKRQPGDIIVWNGGVGGGHTGIIKTVDGKGGTMIHNPCTACGGVKVGRYPYGSRTAASAVVRRVTRT